VESGRRVRRMRSAARNDTTAQRAGRQRDARTDWRAWLNDAPTAAAAAMTPRDTARRSGYKKMRMKMGRGRADRQAGRHFHSARRPQRRRHLCRAVDGGHVHTATPTSGDARHARCRLSTETGGQTDRQSDRADVASTTVAAGLRRKGGSAGGEATNGRTRVTAASTTWPLASEVDGVERSSIEGVTEDDSSGRAA